MRLFQILVFFILLSQPLLVHELEASDFHSPRVAALGGSSHAGPMLNDAIYLNPSFTSFLPTYAISGNYLWYQGGNKDADGNNDYHGHYLNGSVQDGRTELFQAGVGLTLREDAKIFSIGASKAAIQRLTIGMGGKLIFPNDGSRSNITETNLSTTFIVTEWLQAAIMVDNLIQSPKSRSYGFYREFILGTKTIFSGIVMVYFDPHWVPALPDSSFGHESGLEFTIFQDFFFRLGAFRNATIPFEGGARGRGYGTGIGWIGPRISLDYGLERALAPIVATAHTFGLTIYF